MSERPNYNLFRSKDDISVILEADTWRMDVLHAAEQLDLPDWWIGAGFLRNAVWDAIEGRPTEQTRDIDLVYFDSTHIEPERDQAYDQHMSDVFPFADWEVRNQARMHYINNFEPFRSTADGIAHWVETATCVAVKKEQGSLHYLFCYGTDDLFGLIARPAPSFQTPELLPVFFDRIEKKRWREKWPHLKVENS